MTAASPMQARLGRLRALAGGQLGQQASWVILPFGAQQAIRLATNILLAALLAPEMFGIMLLINTLRTGTELLSDIGIGQSVVRSGHHDDPVFLNTAWTIQLGRGLALSLLALAAAGPVAALYDNPDLAPIIRTVSIVFLLMGLQSPQLFLIQREIRLRRRAVYDLSITVFQCALTIALAYLWDNVWALVWGLVLSTAFTTVMSYLLRAAPLPRLVWDAGYVREILKFGKWIFLATALYFAAISTDKIYFSAALPLALVGVYSVARTFADMLATLSQRLGTFLVFPKVASLSAGGNGMDPRFGHIRRTALLLVSAAVAVGLAMADAFILLVYDDRYHAAAFMLPVLLVGIWFAILANFDESTLIGLGKPEAGARGNAMKFAVLAAGLPLAVPAWGLFAGLLVLILAEAARWFSLSLSLKRAGLAFTLEDAGLTLLALGSGALLKAGLGLTGLVPDLGQWWASGALIHG